MLIAYFIHYVLALLRRQQQQRRQRSSGGGSGGGNGSGGGSSDGGDNDAAPPTVAAAPHESVIRHSQKHFHTHTQFPLFLPLPLLFSAAVSRSAHRIPPPFLISLTRLSPIAPMLFWVCFRLLCLFVFLVFIINDTSAFPFPFAFIALSISLPLWSLSLCFLFPFYVTCCKFGKFLNYIYPRKLFKS